MTNPVSRRNPAPEDKREAARAVRHEVVSLRHALDLLTSSEPPEADPYRRHAWTAWYSHARNLRDFFEATGDRRSIRHKHYFPNRVPTSLRELIAKAKTTYERSRLDADALAVHLSWARVDLAREDTRERAAGRSGGAYAPSVEVTEALEAVYRAFVGCVPEEFRPLFEVERATRRGE